MRFMLNSMLCICMACLLFSCNNQPAGNSTDSQLTAIHNGMSYIEVLEMAGFPDTVIQVGITTDTFGLQTKTEEWHYGNNQLIVLVNGIVSSIDLDLQATYRHIQHIIDSARAAGDTDQLIRPER